MSSVVDSKPTFQHRPVPFLRFLYYAVLIALLRVLTRYKIITNKLFNRRVGLVPPAISIKPTRKIWVPSSQEKGRQVEVHVYEPPIKNAGDEKKGPLPVHINFHGSGFVLPNMGEDSEQCVYWASTLGCIVLDSDYVKAPEYPHPAAIYDALDVLAHIHSNPDVYDVTRISIGGVSAGATIAILASLYAPKETFKSVIAWYPATDFTLDEEQRRVPDLPAGAPGCDLPSWLIRLFTDSFLRPGQDLACPELSPMFASSEAFPPISFIVGECDPLCSDTVALAKKLKADGVDCDLMIVKDASHAFDRNCKADTPQWQARNEANAMIEQRLRAAYMREDV